MVSSSSAAQSLSYADRAKLAKSQSSSHSPSSSSTSTTDVEKQPDDAPNGGLVNGLSPASFPAPNFWAVRKEQMAARTANRSGSSSSSPTLAASPSLSPAPLPSSRGANGVDLDDASSWPQVTAAATPVKDKSTAKESITPTPTPKKGEKKKWVLIPPTELQAAADAAARGRSSPKHASAATSTHSSPKTSSRGRHLPNEDITPDTRKHSPSRLAKHAYTHPHNSPNRSSGSLAPLALPTDPHRPPLTLQRRPLSPARSGPVAGYRDIDDLTRATGRLVMFGSIGAPLSPHSSPPQRAHGFGTEAGVEDNYKKPEEARDSVRRPSRGFVIGIDPDELARSRARRRRSAPASVDTHEIVDLTDGAWQQNGGDEHFRERKWEFGTSRHPAAPPQRQQILPPPPPPPMHMYPFPSHMVGYPHPPPHGHPINAPEQIMGDPAEYEQRPYGYDELYVERRGGFSSRRGRYAGGRGGPNGRGYGGRRGGGLAQHYFAQPPPPPPPPGPDGYYMGPPYGVPYIPSPAPVPMPVTLTSFPIDPTRWYLLGQLEYYFSVQNLVTDYWLRQQMDNRGWVPIAVIASFNRVRHLTYDVNLVRDVLQLSAIVEVRGDFVRLRQQGWVHFVLPDAPVSTVPEDDDLVGYTAPGPMEGSYESESVHPMAVDGHTGTGEQRPQEIALVERGEDGDGDEEEDVVFVMGKESEERRDGGSSQWAEQQLHS